MFDISSLLWAISITVLTVFMWHEILSRARRKSLEFFFWLVFTFALIFAYAWNIFIEKDAILFLSQYFISLGGSFQVYTLFFTFVIIGAIIELGKNTIVRFFGRKFFETLDDVVDLSFATALGFTAMENMIYFYDLFLLADTYETPMYIVKEVIVREFFILPIHLFCSGIFGYYYGIALFALPEKRKILGKLYNAIQFLKGTLISTLVFGLFFYILHKDITMGKVAEFFGWNNFPFNESLFPFISFIFSSLTALYLFEKMGNVQFITETKQEKIKRLEEEGKQEEEEEEEEGDEDEE